MKIPAKRQQNTQPKDTLILANYSIEEGRDQTMLSTLFQPTQKFRSSKALSALNDLTVSEYALIKNPTDNKLSKSKTAPVGQGANTRKSTALHVMCVDDDEDILSIACMSLETVGGFKVSCCSSGTEAIERIDEINPDIILLDVMMPMLSGPETLKRLKNTATAEQIPIVFMTARVQPEEIEEYLQIGAAAVVQKPFDPMQLSSQIEEILERAQLN